MNSTKQTKCISHDWKNDPMFEDGTVMLDFGGESEMRQYCEVCHNVRYVPRNTIPNIGKGEKE